MSNFHPMTKQAEKAMAQKMSLPKALPKDQQKPPIIFNSGDKRKRERWQSDFDKASPRVKSIFHLERAKSLKQSKIKLPRVSILEGPERV